MSTIPIISSGLRIMVSFPAFFMSKTALLHVNFNFINRVLLVLLSIILIISNPKISSINRALTFTSFCSSGLILSPSLDILVPTYSKIQIDNLLSLCHLLAQIHSLYPKLNLHFCEFQTPMYIFPICDHVFLQ